MEGPLLSPSAHHALEQAGSAVNQDDPRRFYGYMFLVVAYELTATRRELRALSYQFAQAVGCLNYMATAPSRAPAKFPP